MRRSQLFIKTFKTSPADETARNAQLLIRAGFIFKVMAGVYAYTPLGLRVVEQIKNITREEMNAINGQELIMTNLQAREPWQETGRWNDEVVDIWFKTSLKDKAEIGLAWSHEEAIIDMMRQFVSSYKDLPISVYQFQTKLRNETRAKSGIMRGREFVMKDMYSLSVDAAQHDTYYQSVMDAYLRIYQRLGIGDDTYVTYASGGAFTNMFSHEFQTVCEVGEDTIYLHREKNIAINGEVMDDTSLKQLGIERSELEAVKSSEVGNIFNFGTDKSEQMNFSFSNEAGQKQYVHLGSYGIGITRLMGVIAEKYADEKGLVWPQSIAPAVVYLASLGVSPEVLSASDVLYDTLTKNGVTVLYDDRDTRPGEKFADADLMGIPFRVVVSEKTVAAQLYECKNRNASAPEQLGLEKLLSTLGVHDPDLVY
jgi:prolyl-tRNA synthetase